MTQENYSKIIYYTLAGAVGLALITASAVIGYKIYKKGLEDSSDLLNIHYNNLEKGTE